MSKKIVIVDRVGRDGIGYEAVDIDTYFGLNGSGMTNGAVKGEKALSHSFLMDTLRKVMGRTLTVIDSSITDKQQNKAMKDIIRGIISDELDFAAEMAFDQKVLQKMADDHFEGATDEEIVASSVPLEEVLGVK